MIICTAPLIVYRMEVPLCFDITAAIRSTEQLLISRQVKRLSESQYVYYNLKVNLVLLFIVCARAISVTCHLWLSSIQDAGSISLNSFVPCRRLHFIWLLNSISDSMRVLKLRVSNTSLYAFCEWRIWLLSMAVV